MSFRFPFGFLVVSLWFDFQLLLLAFRPLFLFLFLLSTLLSTPREPPSINLANYAIGGNFLTVKDSL